MSNDRSGMTNYVRLHNPRSIKLADNSILLAYGKGDVKVYVYNGPKKICLVLKEVLFVPDIKKKLLSLSTVTERGTAVKFNEKNCTIIIDGKVLSIGHRDGKLYRLNTEENNVACAYSMEGESSNLQLWHYRYGHLGYNNLKHLKETSMVNGLQFSSKDKATSICEGCAKGKQSREAFLKKSQNKATQLMELIHSDVGVVNVDSVGGSWYYMTFIDDFSSYTFVYFLKSKSDVLAKFKEFVLLMENLTEKKVKTLRSDNGGEYTSIEFQQFYTEHGINRELTVPMTPEQNGKAERMNRTLIESTRAMLHRAKMSSKFWAEALNTAVYLRNRSPTTALEGITPYECFHGEKPDVSNLRVFGCKAFAHVPKEKRSQLEGKSVNCIFVGYPSTSKGFKFYDIQNDKMFISRDAKFLENDFLHDDSRNAQNLPRLSTVFTEEKHDMQNEESENEVATRKSTRKRAVPERFGTITVDWWKNEDIDCSIATLDSIEPRSLNEALNGPNANKWKNAADNEYQSLLSNDTWKLVDLPPGKNVIGCKWVFELKMNADGSISRYKARLVAQGYSQQAGLDYDEVFAPVARYTSIRTVLAIANALDLELHQMDVKTAFLNGELDTEIYMEQPSGYIDNQRPNMVCKLQKSIYGLKQSARCWNLSIDRLLKASGYTQSNADPCIYSKVKDSSLMIIALYVDDILLASNDVMITKFEMEDQGEAN